MADSLPQGTKPRNPNWGGWREGSGRKKNTPMLMALPSVQYLLTQHVCTGNLIVICPGPHIVNNIDTTQIQHLLVNTLTPARGFFAPRFVTWHVWEALGNTTTRLRVDWARYQTARVRSKQLCYWGIRQQTIPRVRSKQLRSAVFGLWVVYVY